jgi:thiol-disulfide isomerase/thioredoxin
MPSKNKKRFWTPARLAATCVVLALIAAFGAASCNMSQPDGSSGANANAPKGTSPSVTVSRGTAATAPAQPAAPVPLPAGLSDKTLSLIDGKSLKLSNYSGKVLVINVWATWCGPCRAEMPDLVKLSHEYKDKGVEVIGLATQNNDPDIDAVRDFARQMNVDYKIVYDDGSFAAPLLQAVRARGVIPQSFVISRDGRILRHFEGYSPVTTPGKMREAVDQALKE